MRIRMERAVIRRNQLSCLIMKINFSSVTVMSQTVILFTTKMVVIFLKWVLPTKQITCSPPNSELLCKHTTWTLINFDASFHTCPLNKSSNSGKCKQADSVWATWLFFVNNLHCVCPKFSWGLIRSSHFLVLHNKKFIIGIYWFAKNNLQVRYTGQLYRYSTVI